MKLSGGLKALARSSVNHVADKDEVYTSAKRTYAKRLSPAKKARAKELIDEGYTPRDVAFSLGITYAQAQTFCRKPKK